MAKLFQEFIYITVRNIKKFSLGEQEFTRIIFEEQTIE